MLNMNNEEALAIIFANSYDALIPEMVSERLMASNPFAGRYRLCDFLISSMVHSGIDNISLIVKKNYHSLMDLSLIHICVCSRREADRQIEAGKVGIDGVTAKTGDRVLKGQTVTYNGQVV